MCVIKWIYYQHAIISCSQSHRNVLFKICQLFESILLTDKHVRNGKGNWSRECYQKGHIHYSLHVFYICLVKWRVITSFSVSSPAPMSHRWRVDHMHDWLLLDRGCTWNQHLSLPYHTGKTFYRIALRPLTGPMRIPKWTVRLQTPQVQYSPGSIPTRGTIPLPSQGLLTWTYLLICTLGISKSISAQKHISTSIQVTMTSKTPNQENPGDPSPNRAYSQKIPKCDTDLGPWSQYLHCALSLAAQCVVIGPVCLCVCGCVGLLPR